MITPAQLETYRRWLLSAVQRLSGDVSQLQEEAAHGLGGESGGGLSNAPTHPADLGNASYEEEMELALLANEEQLLAECNAALARLDAGTFGLCEECRREISKRRLDASPFVRYCIDCARRREGGAGR